MDAGANRELFKRREQMWNSGNTDLVDQLFAADFVGHTPHQQIRGSEELKALVGQIHEAFPDFSLTYDPVVASEDHVAVMVTIHGTHDGSLAGLEPTGKEVEFTGMIISRIDGGKVVEEWRYMDTIGLLEQLGVELGSDEAEQIMVGVGEEEERRLHQN